MTGKLITKWCKFCQKEHPHTVEYYHRNKQQKSGLHPYCKKQRNYYKNSTEERIALKNKLRQETRENERRKKLLSQSYTIIKFELMQIILRDLIQKRSISVPNMEPSFKLDQLVEQEEEEKK